MNRARRTNEPTTLTDYHRLGVAVVQQILTDYASWCVTPGRPRTVSRDAAKMLHAADGDDRRDFEDWCKLAHLNADVIRRAAEDLRTRHKVTGARIVIRIGVR